MLVLNGDVRFLRPSGRSSQVSADRTTRSVEIRHLAHAALTDERDDFVRAESRTGRHAHFFNPDVQLMTTVMGETGASTAMLTRNR